MVTAAPRYGRLRRLVQSLMEMVLYIRLQAGRGALYVPWSLQVPLLDALTTVRDGDAAVGH